MSSHEVNKSVPRPGRGRGGRGAGGARRGPRGGRGPRGMRFLRLLDAAVGVELAGGALPRGRHLALAIEDDLLGLAAGGQELDLARDLLDGAEVEVGEVDVVVAAAVLVVDDVGGGHVVRVDALGCEQLAEVPPLAFAGGADPAGVAER